jgi:hypothetical protein
MRRTVFLILTAALLIFGLAACSGYGKVSGSSYASPEPTGSRIAAAGDNRQTAATTAGSSQSTAVQQERREETGSPDSSGTVTAQAGESKTAAGSQSQESKPVQQEKAVDGKSTGVVAKSGNVVSGEDNGKVMKELDRELDALFSGINKLEDVDNADLTGERTNER